MKPNTSYNSFGIFFRGLLMGICDLIPGISGGTIAFITGIYERLIKSISEILSFKAITQILILLFSLNLKKINNVFKKYDLYFLILLFSGILIAIFLGSRIISYLLDFYFVLTMSFFIGLILSSAFLIYKKIDDHLIIDRFFGIIGFCFGLAVLFLVPANTNISLFYVFISGFIGISAMFLPGISGSYLLYILGSYDFILNAVKNFSFNILIFFVLGAILGAVFISHLIEYLLKNFHSKTLYFLFGFVIGALFIPLHDILANGVSGFNLFLSILLFFIGFLIVLVMSKIGSK